MQQLLQAHECRCMCGLLLTGLFLCCCACSDTDTPCYNQVPAEIALKIVSKIKVRFNEAPGRV